MNRKKRTALLSLLLAMCMIFSTPAISLQAEENVVEIVTEENLTEEIVSEETSADTITQEAVLKGSTQEGESEKTTEETVSEEMTEEATTEEISEETMSEGTMEEELTTEETSEEATTEEQTEELTTETLTEDAEFIPEEVSEEAGVRTTFAMRRARNVVPQDGDRYTVLVLDTSGSMSGTPMRVAKQAGIKFCDSVLEADGTNYVAIVTLNTYSDVECDFTNDAEILENTISSMYASGGTNVEDALSTAGSLLENVAVEDAVKNIVLLSDGLPEYGKTLSVGHYTRESHWYCYKYANAAYETATTLKEDYYIYTLGFFHSMYGSNLEFGKQFMTDLQNAGYYEVTNVDELEFTFGEIADDIKALKKKGTFRYASGSESDYTATYYYDDAYFTKSSYEYNPSLATMSISLAMSAFGSNDTRNAAAKNELGPDYSKYSQNVERLLTDVGYENIKTNEYYNVKPSLDSIGVVAGNKKIKQSGETYTLIAVAVRGAGYESEWGSNFTIGTSGEHQGFREAKENVLKFIKQYIDEQQIEGKIKIWITGYSRAAATTNLTAAALDKSSSTYLGNKVTLEPKDLYAYCFETPQGALTVEATDSIYDNIYSVINPNDPVPMVAMSGLGFRQYGTRMEVIPTVESDENYAELKKQMLQFYYNLDSTEEYTVDDFKMKKISIVNIILDGILAGNRLDTIIDDTKNNWSQNRFLSEFVNMVAKDIAKTRSNYVKEYQDSIRETCSIVFGTILADPQKLDAFTDELSDQMMNKMPALVYYLVLKNDEAGAASCLEQVIVDAANEVGITGYTSAQVNALALDLLKLVSKIVIFHPNYTTTLVYNIDSIGSAHYPELCYAWLCSKDENYTTYSAEWETNGDYRIIHINCPVDVEVYNSKNEVVAKIVDDVPVAIAGREGLSSITYDGDKEIILPVNESYTVNMIATDEGLVNCSIKEFSLEAGETVRVLNYYDMPVQTGDVLSVAVSRVSEETIAGSTVNGTTTSYAVTNQKGETVDCNVELSGNSAKNAYYYVSVKADNDTNGVVLGSGTRQVGSFAKLEAIAKEGHEFYGWYENGVLLSTDAEYRIRVEQDRTIIAVFDSELTTPSKPSGNAGTTNTKNDDDEKTQSSVSDSSEEQTEQATVVETQVETEEMTVIPNETVALEKSIETKTLEPEKTTVREEEPEDISEEIIEGTKTEEMTVEEQIEESTIEESSMEESMVEEETSQGNELIEEETNNSTIIYIIICVCVLIAGIGIYLVYTAKRRKLDK